MLAVSAGVALMAAGQLATATEEAELRRLGQVTKNTGQAMPRGARIAAGAEQRNRGQAKRKTRKAAADLVDATGRTIVLGHIHPRWLRRQAERMMDAGFRVTSEVIEGLRKEPPCFVCGALVDEYCDHRHVA
jgi:hypothetical protein